MLIHEATLEDDKPEDAELKGHSTFGQAIEAGKRMNARYVILNHFSQRYPKIPKLPAPEVDAEDVAVAGPTVAISFDFMSLRAADAWKMSHFTEPLSLLYADAEEEEGMEAAEAEEETAKAQEGKGKKKEKKEKGKKGGESGEGKGEKKGEGKQGKKWVDAESKTNGEGRPGNKRPSDASADEPVAKKVREAVSA